ncbi:MAG: molybdopterin-dependent oxidoreductase [Candidatus Korobacteraceae bacterium]
MNRKRQRLESLPVHPTGRAGAEPKTIRIDGLAAHPAELALADLQRLPQQELTEDFSCEEGWTVPNLKWQGPTLEAVLAIAEPHSEAKWVQASAGDFSVPIPLQEAHRVLLAISLGGEAVPTEHGGPVRLVLAGGDCWTSIKWIDHLELRAAPGENTGKTIALGRLCPS